MTYRDLLKMCKQKPGCIRTAEQLKRDSEMMYRLWLDKVDLEYIQNMIIKDPLR